jgi:L,D-transpeptidase catalytic domain
MFKPKTLLLLLVIIFSLGWLSSSGLWKRNKPILLGHPHSQRVLANTSLEKMKEKAADAKKFISQNNFNTSTCFLVDMSLPSGQNRFFVYDLAKDTIQQSGLVTHGRCNQYWLEGRKYDNTVGCGCTSLGKYKIGNPYNGRFGLAFKLYGLDKTNDKAFSRFVVLHSHSCVPESEVKDDICQSDGCPTVAPGFLLQLKSILNDSRKPVLLWIYQ